MTFFYIDPDNGTCVNTDGAFGTIQSDAFGTGALTNDKLYASLKSAIDNGGGALGDIFCYKANPTSPENYGSSTVIAGFAASGTPAVLISVNSSSPDTYQRSTSNQIQASFNGYIRGRWLMAGIQLGNMGNMSVGGASQLWMYQVTWANTGTYLFGALNDGSHVYAYDCDFDGSGTTAICHGGNASSLEFHYCRFTDMATVLLPAADGNCRVHFYYCDTEFTDYIITNSGMTAPGEDFDVRLIRCKLSGTYSGITEAPFVSPGQRLLMQGCGSDTDAQWQYYYESFGGKVESLDSVYRSGTPTIGDGATQVSYRVTTNTDANKQAPFVWPLPKNAFDLGDTGSDVVTVEFLSDDAGLMDDEVRFYLPYTDSDGFTPNSVERISNFFDVLRSPGSVDTSGETWTGVGSNTAYYATLDVSGNLGIDQAIDVIGEFAIASTVFYIDPLMDAA